MKTKIVAMIILSSVMGHYLATGQCANSSNVDSFVYNGQTYEVIKEPKNWADAASCAVQRGVFWQKLIMLLNRVPFIQR